MGEARVQLGEVPVCAVCAKLTDWPEGFPIPRDDSDSLCVCDFEADEEVVYAPVVVLTAEPASHLAIAREALREIATRPITERNPDGDEQAAHSMRVIARDALAQMEGEDR